MRRVYVIALLLSASFATTASAQSPTDLAGDAVDDVPALEALPAEATSTAAAQGALDRFFEREPLGFTPSTLEVIADDLVDSVNVLAELVSDWLALPAGELALAVGGLVVGLLLLVLLGWVDRRIRAAFGRLSTRAKIGETVLLTGVVQGIVRIGGRLVLPTLLVLVSYIGVRGVFEQVAWSVLLSHLLLLWTLYRLLRGVVIELINNELIEMTDEHTAAVQRGLLWAVGLIVVFRAAYSVVAELGYRDDALALVDFVMRAALTGWVVHLLFIHSAVLDLMPDVGPRLYLRIRSALDRYYNWLLGLTSLLGVIWTFGYRHAAVNVLWRTYAAVAVMVIASLLLRRAVRWLEPAHGEEDAEQRTLIRALLEAGGGYIRFFLVLALGLGALHLLGIYDPIAGLIGFPLFSFGEVSFSLATFVRAVIVLLTFLLASRIVRRLLEIRLLPRFELDEGMTFAITATVHYVVLVVGGIAALLATGLDLTALGIFAGALGLGVGFGLQEIVRDVVAGFILLFGQAVKKGDYITVNNEFGEVQRVGARSITLKTRDAVELVIPTSQIVNGQITNWSHTSPLVRIHIEVGVTYSADPHEVAEVLKAAAAKFDGAAKKPAPSVWLTGFGDSSVNFTLLIWLNIKNYAVRTAKGELYFIIWDALKENGIEIPFPQRDLHLRSANPKLRELMQPPADEAA